MADQQNTLQGTSIMPSLTVNNLQESEKFFTALGFEIEDRWEDNGVLMGLMLKGGNARSDWLRTTAKRARIASRASAK